MASVTINCWLIGSVYKVILLCLTEFKLGAVHSLPTNEEGEQWTWNGEDNKEASGEESNNHDELCNQDGKYLWKRNHIKIFLFDVTTYNIKL